MKILVTGGAGFIGSHIADAFIGRGDEVVILDNLSSGSRHNVNPKAELVIGDIRDAALVDRLFAEHKFEIVNHHAAQLDVRKSVEDPLFDGSVNILGSITLLEAARKQGGVKLFMFASTGGAVYGEQEYFPADEAHPTNPISPYGIAKRSIELYLNYYEKIHGLPYVAFRYTNVYGPRQNAHGEAGVVAIFIDKLLSGETPIINGAGQQTRDYVFVEDVVRAHMLAAERLSTGIYNLATNTESNVNEVYRLIAGELPHSELSPTHGPAKAGEQQRSLCSYALIERELGWKPTVNLAEGLRTTVRSFQDAAK